MTDLVVVRDSARFTAPARTPGVISRKRLDRLFAEMTGNVVRVLAPGGFGKSTLVAGWVEGDHRPSLWLDLERIDNDPLVLATALARGLDTVLGRVGMQPDERRTGATDLIEVLERCEQPVVIVLDDIHHLDNEASTAIVDALAEHLPTSSTLVLVGRAHHHASAFAGLRLRREVVDVTADDLAFDLPETELLLASMGVELDGAAVIEIADQFEGWAAGLRLAGIVMTTQEWSDRSPIEHLGDTAYVTDYLAAEWIGRLDAADRRFLTEAGCLRRFTGEMCDDVLGRTDSAATLERLGRTGVSVLPLDQHGDWYRMHSLLARWLAADLRDRDRARWCEIHIAASYWWEREGDIDFAIEHGRRAGALELCERLVVDHAGAYMSSGLYPTTRRWMAAFSDQRIAASPQLSALASIAAGHVGDGERALQWARSLRSALSRERASDVQSSDELELQSMALQATLEIEPPAELVLAGEHAVGHLPTGFWRAYAGWSLGGNLFLCGDPRASEVLRQAAFDAEIARATVLTVNCLATCAIVTEFGGGRAASGELGRRATDLVATGDLECRPPTALIVAYASLVQARSGKRALAVRSLDLARSHLAHFDDVGPWFNIIGRLSLVRTCLLLDDIPAAQDLLRELDSWMATQPDGTPVAVHVDALRVRLATASVSSTHRSSQLTASELRVLQYLTTNLSLAEIASRLFVSRNTVKTHAVAVYRKLGASGRSETVEIARSVGLVDDTVPEL